MKETTSTIRKSAPRKGTTFTKVGNDNKEEEGEALPLPTYK